MTTHNNTETYSAPSTNETLTSDLRERLPSESLNEASQSQKSVPSRGAQIAKIFHRFKSARFKSGDRPLRTQLLLSILPVVLLPMALASGIGYVITGQAAKREALLELKQHGLQVNETTDIYILDAFKAMNLVMTYPLMKQALSKGNQVEASAGLAQQSIEAVEGAYKSNKLIVPDSGGLGQLLQETVEQSDFTKILLTSRQGFNVTSSRPLDDVVQHEETWWQRAQDNKYIGDVEIDEVTDDNVLPLATPIKNGDTTLGTLKAHLNLDALNQSLEALVAQQLNRTEILQLVNISTGNVEESITNQGISTEAQGLYGGDVLLQAGQILTEALAEKTAALDTYQSRLQSLNGVSEVELESLGEGLFRTVIAQLKYQNRYYSLSTIPDTTLLTYASEATGEVGAAGRDLLLIFGLIALILGGAASLWIAKVAERISNPITKLATKAQAMAAGDLSLRADVEGSQEAQRLANDFNNMVEQVETLLNRQKLLTQEQQEAREKLEREIQQLLDEVGDAMDGDLTVRASLSSLEMSTVADLVNAIIDNLSDIAIQVKQSTGQVTEILTSSEASIEKLAQQADSGSKDTKEALVAVAKMTESIQDVANNANQAASITDDAYLSAQEGAGIMEQTVEGILSLRTTVGETAKKMKQLGESSQKISQVVSAIDEIALKTNFLAINASVEASRAGEQGQGFAVVAEQVGALAEQSANATKDIAQIVAEIQAETNEVTNAMELGTAKVVETTKMVESTKTSLENLLQQAQRINDLMGTISSATDAQASTSRTIRTLMQRLAKMSKVQSLSSQQLAESLQTGTQVAGELQSTVEQFKAEEEIFI